MVKSLFLAWIVLGVFALIFLYVMTLPPQQAVERRKAVNEQPAKQVRQPQVAEAAVNDRVEQVPVEGKKATDRPKAAERQTSFTLPLNKDGSISGPLVINTPLPPPPKAEPGKAPDEFGSILPDGLPLWFRTLDKDEDGQVALYEWRKSGKSIEEFRKYDRNNDGLITAEEVLKLTRKSIELKLAKGEAKYNGSIESTDDMYKGKKLSKIFTVKFEKGKTYLIDHKSRDFDAYLYLEDPDGKVLAEDDDGGEGNDSRIVHQATRNGTYRIIATSVGGYRPGAFSLLVRNLDGGTTAAKSLPSWFKDLDKNKDGQIALHEWRGGGESIEEFRKYDLNGDGLITAEELMRSLKLTVDLKLEDGQVEYIGAIEESHNERYQGKKTFKIFTIKFDTGKAYQIEHACEAFSAYLFLEDSDGKIVDKQNAGGKGLAARIVHRAEKAGVYRIIATTQDGGKTTDFSLSVRVVSSYGGIWAKDLPPWFRDLDKNDDGQLTLTEWREGGKSLDEFRKFDLDGDGLITAAEIIRQIRPGTELKVQKGQPKQNEVIDLARLSDLIDLRSGAVMEAKSNGPGGAKFSGTIEGNDQKYQGKKLSKTFSVKFEKGKTYQIDVMSQDFSAYLYLEDANGKFLDKIHSGGKGLTARIVHRAAEAGNYRLIVTSQEGDRTGAFSISVRVKG